MSRSNSSAQNLMGEVIQNCPVKEDTGRSSDVGAVTVRMEGTAPSTLQPPGTWALVKAFGSPPEAPGVTYSSVGRREPRVHTPGRSPCWVCLLTDRPHMSLSLPESLSLATVEDHGRCHQVSTGPDETRQRRPRLLVWSTSRDPPGMSRRGPQATRPS